MCESKAQVSEQCQATQSLDSLTNLQRSECLNEVYWKVKKASAMQANICFPRDWLDIGSTGLLPDSTAKNDQGSL